MRGRFLVGVAILSLGVLLLLDRLGRIDFGAGWSVLWPSFLVIAGVLVLVEHRGRSFVGVALLLAGAFFLADHLGYIGRDWADFIWPALLIAVGIVVLAGLGRGARGAGHHGSSHGSGGGHAKDEGRPSAHSGSAASSSSAVEEGRRFDRTVLFGALEARVTSAMFERGSVTAAFAGAVLDLRDARLSPEGASLDVTAVCGGVTLVVPPGMRVALSGTPILGGIEDDRRGGAESSGGPLLSVRATAICGGVEVTDKPR